MRFTSRAIVFGLSVTANAENLDTSLAALSCLGCHADIEQPATGRLAEPASLRGLDVNAMVSVLRDYREGKRSGTVMNRIAAGLKDADIEGIARFLGKRQ
ncbi:cytochrome c family protein [Methylococcus geothermalis]|uniref:Cytochrome c family protein n=1 Tax=Methylococcus geothermalis TaxID=2681310 RepID=A0A858QCF5_9GAMM|nr:cytochrome c family protein [Methylococcus geothermalis]